MNFESAHFETLSSGLMLEIYKKPCCMISIRKAGLKSFALKAIQEGFRYIVAVKLLHSEDSFNGMIHRQVISCHWLFVKL